MSDGFWDEQPEYNAVHWWWRDRRGGGAGGGTGGSGAASRLGGFLGAETAREDPNRLTINKLLANSRVTGAFDAAWRQPKSRGKRTVVGY